MSTPVRVKEEKIKEEKIYECEVRRIRVVEGKKIPFWKSKGIRDAIDDGDTDFRCKDCHGKVKLFRRHVAHAPAPHAEHMERADSEYCPAGVYFRQSVDGREPRLSERPVQ